MRTFILCVLVAGVALANDLTAKLGLPYATETEIAETVLGYGKITIDETALKAGRVVLRFGDGLTLGGLLLPYAESDTVDALDARLETVEDTALFDGENGDKTLTLSREEYTITVSGAGTSVVNGTYTGSGAPPYGSGSHTWTNDAGVRLSVFLDTETGFYEASLFDPVEFYDYYEAGLFTPAVFTSWEDVVWTTAGDGAAPAPTTTDEYVAVATTTLSADGLTTTGEVTAASFTGSGAGLTDLDYASITNPPTLGTMAGEDAADYATTGTVAEVEGRVTALEDKGWIPLELRYPLDISSYSYVASASGLENARTYVMGSVAGQVRNAVGLVPVGATGIAVRVTGAAHTNDAAGTFHAVRSQIIQSAAGAAEDTGATMQTNFYAKGINDSVITRHPVTPGSRCVVNHIVSGAASTSTNTFYLLGLEYRWEP